MPVCSFGTHRLRLDRNARCQQCGNALPAYALVRDLAGTFFNEARRRWEVNDLGGAAAWLEASIALIDDLAEAHWLLGLIRLRCNERARGQESLARAQALGAPIQADLLTGEFPSDATSATGTISG